MAAPQKIKKTGQDSYGRKAFLLAIPIILFVLTSIYIANALVGLKQLRQTFVNQTLIPALVIFLLFVVAASIFISLRSVVRHTILKHPLSLPLFILIISLLGTLTSAYTANQDLIDRGSRGLTTAGEYLPLLIALAGSSISFLLFGMVYFLASSRQQAIALAEQITAELAEREDELADYIDRMTTFNAKLDARGNFIHCNRAISEASNIPYETIIHSNFLGSPWWTYDAAVARAVKTAFHKARANKRTIIFNARAKFGEKIIYLNMNITPILNEAGEIGYFIAEGRDITDLEIAQERLKKRTADLERLTQSMVGRELKMIELKNELKHLKQNPEEK